MIGEFIKLGKGITVAETAAYIWPETFGRPKIPDTVCATVHRGIEIDEALGIYRGKV